MYLYIYNIYDVYLFILQLGYIVQRLILCYIILGVNTIVATLFVQIDVGRIVGEYKSYASTIILIKSS